MPRLDRVVAAFLLLVFVVMTAVAAGYQYEARLMPLVVGMPAVVLAAVQCFKPGAKEASRAGDVRAELLALGWLAAFGGLVAIGGVLVGGSVAVALAQRVWLRESWRTALAGGALSAALLLAVFERQLGVFLFQGLLFERLP